MSKMKLFGLVLLLLGSARYVIESQGTNTPSQSAERISGSAQNIAFIEHFGGSASAVAVQGNYAYAGIGCEFAVIDIAQPANPRRVAYLILPTNNPYTALPTTDIFLDGDYAYVSHEQLYIIDISDPLNPTLIGSVPGKSNGVAVRGQYAYVAGGGGLRILDISEPTNPVPVGSYSEEDGYGWGQDIVIFGRYVYYTVGFWGPDTYVGSYLRVVDVLDPAHPTSIVKYPKYIYAVALEGNIVYAVGDLNLYAVDISNPLSITTLYTETTRCCLAKITVNEGIAYVSRDPLLYTVDVSDPSHSTELGAYESGRALDAAIQGSYGYIVNGNALRVVNIQDPAQLVEVGAYQTIGEIYRVTVRDNRAYIPSEGLHILSVEDPHNPFVVGTAYSPTVSPVTADVTVNGNYAYLVGDFLTSLDISNPNDPVPVGFYHPSPPYYLLRRIVVSDTHVFLGGWALHIIDVSDPSHPTEVGVISESVNNLSIVGSHLYELSNSQLIIRDISNVTQPISVSAYYLGPSLDIEVVESYAYIARGNLEIIDVSNPAQPIHVSSYQTNGGSIAVANEYAYVAAGAGVRVVKVSTPTSPVAFGFYDFYDTLVAHDIAATNDDYIYVACGYDGLYILKRVDPRAFLPLVTR